MCGRFSLTQPPDRITQHFSLDPASAATAPPRYNIAPSQTIYAVRWREGKPELAEPRWGLIPAWNRQEKAHGMINARAETVADKPAFRSAFRSRRCLIPADGFYEWKAEGKKKQPWYITLHDTPLFAFAGLWENSVMMGAPAETCAILTTTPNQRLAAIHDRMPVILSPADYATWLSGDPEAAHALLRPYPAEAFHLHPASPLVSASRPPQLFD